jgi:hypothetical protein
MVELLLISTLELLPGECGSLVVDQTTSDVYGHIVGCGPDGVVHTVPLKNVFSQIGKVFGTEKLSIFTPNLASPTSSSKQHQGNVLSTPKPSIEFREVPGLASPQSPLPYSSSAKLSIARAKMYTNAVYWPNHRVYNGDTPGTLNYGCINRVYYAFANVTADGGVFVSPVPQSSCTQQSLTMLAQLSDEWADATAPCDGVQGALGSLINLKQRYPHLQVVLSVGGGASAETFPIVASNTILRDNFARSVRGLVEASGLDGIDSESSSSLSWLPSQILAPWQ